MSLHRANLLYYLDDNYDVIYKTIRAEYDVTIEGCIGHFKSQYKWTNQKWLDPLRGRDGQGLARHPQLTRHELTAVTHALKIQ